MSIDLQLPKPVGLKPRITVIGVGGAGGNAINNMIASGLEEVEYIVANTDAQALAMSSAERRIQLGVNLTEGLGAGSKPEIGEAAALEAVDDVRSAIAGSHMVFIAAGMGGGTGTGAAGVIARVSQELGILTVGIVTKPFQFEGTRRARTAEAGIAELRKYVDTLIVIPNQNLFRVTTEKTTFPDAFRLADQVLYSGVACIVDLIVKDGLINLDFADVRTVMKGMGSAMMGTGEASGEGRATAAAEQAISNPLLDDVSLDGAKGLLLSIIGGQDMTLYEVDEAASRVRREVDPEANIIVGAAFDDSMEDRIRVAIVASGLGQPQASRDGYGRHEFAPPPIPRDAHHSNSEVAYASNAPRARDRQRGWVPGAARRAETPPPPRHSAVSPDNGNMSRVAEDDAASDTEGRSAEPDRDAEVWHAPDGVVIEQGRAPGGPSSNAGGSVPHGGQRGFTPAPPAPVRRARRPMPDVEDFPPVGQREYRAKMGQDRDGAGAPRIYGAQPPATEPRKRGLFQRLVDAGRGRRADEEPQGMDNREEEISRPPADEMSLPHFVKRDRH